MKKNIKQLNGSLSIKKVWGKDLTTLVGGSDSSCSSEIYSCCPGTTGCSKTSDDRGRDR